MNEEIKISEVIADFVKFLNNAQFSYTYMLEKMGEQDKITQDILHQLELENLKYNEVLNLLHNLLRQENIAGHSRIVWRN